MHGNAIVHKLISEAEKLGEFKEIFLVIGELANIELVELKEAMHDHVPWKVNIKKEESQIRCSCGYEGKAEIVERGHDFCLFRCPRCKGKPEVLKGGNIRIVGVK